MANTGQYDTIEDQRAALFQSVIEQLGAEALANPQLADIVMRRIDQGLAPGPGPAGPQPTDGGLADLIGLGGSAPGQLGQTQIPAGIEAYDDALDSRRLLAAADLYYVCLHDLLGVFRIMWKLQELFRAGTLRLSDGPGAFALYRFDKHSILRYRTRDRLRAYRRVFGYTNADPGRGARPNPDFHPLFTHFVAEVAKFWRDKRISEVVREGGTDLTFGSIAIVRRSGLDLRNNVKNSSYGFVNVLRIEASQALAEAFTVLNAPDVRNQFGTRDAWETIEQLNWQYFHRTVYASTVNRMAVTGRLMLKWLSERFILLTDRLQFENALRQIAEPAEEWLSSEEAMRISRPTPPPSNVYVPGPPPAGPRRGAVARPRSPVSP